MDLFEWKALQHSTHASIIVLYDKLNCKFSTINPLLIFCHAIVEKQIIELLRGFTVSAVLCILMHAN